MSEHVWLIVVTALAPGFQGTFNSRIQTGEPSPLAYPTLT